jgi:2-methylisocitrate lyase-like PEP mutase family enzyme
MPDLVKKAETLRALHVPGDPLILVNVWDAASARTVAAAAGCRAIATASWSIAAAHGVDDGALGAEAALAAVARIAAAVDLPVTADLESGFGDAGDAVRRAIAAGAAGGNLEDALAPVDAHVAAIRAARAAGDAAGVPFVINARGDEFLHGGGDLGEALARGRAYLAAGADCFFVPALHDLPAIRHLAEELDGRVSLLASPASPPLAELADAGVSRVSFGPGPLGLAYAALGEAAATLIAGGPYPPQLASRPPRG